MGNAKISGEEKQVTKYMYETIFKVSKKKHWKPDQNITTVMAGKGIFFYYIL